MGLVSGLDRKLPRNDADLPPTMDSVHSLTPDTSTSSETQPPLLGAIGAQKTPEFANGFALACLSPWQILGPKSPLVAAFAEIGPSALLRPEAPAGSRAPGCSDKSGAYKNGENQSLINHG